MKRTLRILAVCLAVVMLLLAVPFEAIAAVSAPSSVKSVVFNATYYANKYADLKAAFGTDATKLYNHFLNNGVKEGRQASPFFSVDYYLTKNADLKAAFGTNREAAFNHFCSYGVKEPRVAAAPVNLGTGIDVRISMASNGMSLGYSGTNVQTATSGVGNDQLWTLTRYSDGAYKITNKATGKVLDVAGASRASGTNVGIYASNDSNAQRWYIHDNLDGTYSIRAKLGTTCALTVKGGSSAAGTNVLMSTFTGAASQKFSIKKVSELDKLTPVDLGSDFTANIRGVGSNYNIALSADNALIRYPNMGYNQVWRFNRFSDGSYRISNLKTGDALTCSWGKGDDGTNVHTYISNGENYQRWYIYKVNGYYFFAPKCSNTCVLEVAGGATASGTNVELGTYSASSKAQQFKILKLTESNTEKNLAISEICATPTNGAYEFMELMNASDVSVNLNQYSLYRFSAVNSGKYEFSSYYRLLGLPAPTGSDTSLSYMNILDLSSCDTEIDPGELVVLWFVTYANRTKTVEDFKAYWTSQGSDMTGVTVIPIAIYSGTDDVHAANKINSGAGAGFLPDLKVASAYSLIKNTALKTRLENGKNLNTLEASVDAPLAYNYVAELQSRADSIALQFVSTTAEKGTSRNFYNYVDPAAFTDTAIAKIQDYILDYKHTYTPYVYPAQVGGSHGTDGCPSSVGEYFNYSSGNVSVASFGVDCGLEKTKPTPGTKWYSQFPGLDLVSTKVDSSGNVTFTGSFKYNEYKTAGFVITTVHTESGATVAKKTVTTTSFTKTADGYTYSIKVSGLPVNDGSVVLNVVPYAVSSATNARVNGIREQIRCPLVSATINGSSIEGLKVTYMLNEETAPIDDVTGIMEAVKLLANDIEYYTGVEVEIAAYDPRADYPQIVIASSGTGSGGDALVPVEMRVGTSQYGLFYSNGDIFAVGGSAIAAEYASQRISEALRKASGSVELKSLCSNSVKSFNAANNKLGLTDGAEYRLMTFNAERFELNADTSRISNFVTSLQYYSPDVVGFQEYCAKFTSLLTPKLKDLGYTVIGNEVSGAQNYAPLAYKTSKFTCVAKGWFTLSGETNYPGHHVTWAVLKDKTTGERFAVSTAHFYHKSDRTVADPIRAINAQEMVDLAKTIKSKYGCPMVNFGDYNSYSMDEAYSILVNSGVANDSRYDAIRGYSTARTSHLDNSSAPRTGGEALSIDLFFTMGDVTVLRNRMPMNRTVAGAADHYPVYVDIAIS